MNAETPFFSSKHLILLTKFIILMVCLGLVTLTACGRRTPPRPLKTLDSFGQLTVTQRGEQIRLSWVMQKPLPQQNGSQQFQIEATQLDPHCPSCPPLVIPARIFPFPSEDFTIEGRRVFLALPIPKDLKAHAFKVTHQALDEDPLSPPQVFQFTKFVEFPPRPALQWTFLPTGTLPELKDLPTSFPREIKDLRFVRLSWQPLQEKIAFYFSTQGELDQRTPFYRINIYKTQPGKPWSQRPINARPIAETFYIDYQLKLPQAFLYQIRLVDSEGNESAPSRTYTISPRT